MFGESKNRAPKSSLGVSFFSSILIYGGLASAALAATAGVRSIVAEREVPVVLQSPEPLPPPPPVATAPSRARRGRRSAARALSAPREVPRHEPTAPDNNTAPLSDEWVGSGDPFGDPEGTGWGTDTAAPEVIEEPEQVATVGRVRPRVVFRQRVRLTVSDRELLTRQSVRARITINQRGEVQTAELLSTSGLSESLRQRLIESIRQWRFAATPQSGLTFLQPIRFESVS